MLYISWTYWIYLGWYLGIYGLIYATCVCNLVYSDHWMTRWIHGKCIAAKKLISWHKVAKHLELVVCICVCLEFEFHKFYCYILSHANILQFISGKIVAFIDFCIYLCVRLKYCQNIAAFLCPILSNRFDGCRRSFNE